MRKVNSTFLGTVKMVLRIISALCLSGYGDFYKQPNFKLKSPKRGKRKTKHYLISLGRFFHTNSGIFEGFDGKNKRNSIKKSRSDIVKGVYKLRLK